MSSSSTTMICLLLLASAALGSTLLPAFLTPSCASLLELASWLVGIFIIVMLIHGTHLDSAVKKNL